MTSLKTDLPRIPNDRTWTFAAWDIKSTHGRMFHIYTQAPNKVWIEVLGEYPKGLGPGHSNVRTVLYANIIEDVELYNLMITNSRPMRKKKAELFKEAKLNCLADPNYRGGIL